MLEVVWLWVEKWPRMSAVRCSCDDGELIAAAATDHDHVTLAAAEMPGSATNIQPRYAPTYNLCSPQERNKKTYNLTKSQLIATVIIVGYISLCLSSFLFHDSRQMKVKIVLKKLNSIHDICITNFQKNRLTIKSSDDRRSDTFSGHASRPYTNTDKHLVLTTCYAAALISRIIVIIHYVRPSVRLSVRLSRTGS